MEHTKQFIEDAIEGGWDLDRTGRDEARILLDPQAWQAVGRVRGWIDGYTKSGVDCRGWLALWHTFIDALSEGDSIDIALSKIT